MAQPKRSKKTGRFLKKKSTRKNPCACKHKKPSVKRKKAAVKRKAASAAAHVIYVLKGGSVKHASPCKTKTIAASWAKAYGYDPKKKNVRVVASCPKGAKMHGKKMVRAKMAYWKKLAK